MIPDTIKDFFEETNFIFDYKKINPPELNNEYEMLEWILHESNMPYLPLYIPGAPYDEMLKEAKKIDHLYSEHRITKNSSGQYESYGWSSACIHGIEWNKTENYDKYTPYSSGPESEVPYDWCEEITSLCPITTNFFKNIFPATGYRRVRFMKLAPGGFINPHVDMKKPLLYAINIALNNPTGCNFRMLNKGNVPFQIERACAVDTSNKHSVWNNSNETRYHIIAVSYTHLTLPTTD